MVFNVQESLRFYNREQKPIVGWQKFLFGSELYDPYFKPALAAMMTVKEGEIGVISQKHWRPWWNVYYRHLRTGVLHWGCGGNALLSIIKVSHIAHHNTSFCLIYLTYLKALNDDNKILTETETFFTIQNFPKLKSRLFSETKFFRNRNRYFFSKTKFSETETFSRDQIFPKPILFFRDQIFQNRDFFPRPNFSETETETFFPRPNFLKPKPKPSKIWQNSRDRDFSTSFEMKFGKFGTYKQNWNFWDQNLGLYSLTKSKLSPLGNVVQKHTMTNTIRLKITCLLLLFTVLWSRIYWT